MAVPKWLTILKTIGPTMIAVLVPGGAILAPIILGAIEQAEKIPGATGPEKKAASLELVKAGATALSTASQGHIVVDPVEAAKAAENAIDAVVGAVNIVAKATPLSDVNVARSTK